MSLSKIKIIGDDIYFDNELVATFQIPETTLRDRFVEAIDPEGDDEVQRMIDDARESGYDAGYDEGYDEGFSEGKAEAENE